MSQQRQVSPLPAGRYWLIVNGPIGIRDFEEWVRDMAGAVVVEASELSQNGGSVFVIFNVPQGRAPFLDAVRFGFPNDAPPSVRTAQDVIQTPHAPEPGLESVREALPELGAVFQSPFFWAVVIAALATGGLSGALQSRRTSRA